MTNIKLSDFDAAEYLTDDEAIAMFMSEALATGDAEFVAHALSVIARAKGMTQIAKESGLARDQLYRTFSNEGSPTLQTTLAVMKALGISLTATPLKVA